jgi:hypothetical protein
MLVLQKMIKALFFEKNGNIFCEHWQKSRKIVIITSNPGSMMSMYKTEAAVSQCPFPSLLERVKLFEKSLFFKSFVCVVKVLSVC